MDESLIPRADFPTIMDNTVHSFYVNRSQRDYYPWMFDRSMVSTKPPNFYFQELHQSEKYFPLYNNIVYGACVKNKNTLFSRCYLYDTDTKEHRYILMRVMSTTCDKPIRVFYVYDTLLKCFSKEAGND